MRSPFAITRCLAALSFVTFLCANLYLCAQPASALTKKERVRLASVRVTTGVVSVTGWEKALIKNDPSLSHWHWDPMYSYKTGYPSIPDNRVHSKAKGASQAVSRYGKPAHLPLPTRPQPDSNITENLNGKIEVPQKSEAQQETAAAIKCQPVYSTATKPVLLNSGKANMSVHARLASRSRGI